MALVTSSPPNSQFISLAWADAVAGEDVDARLPSRPSGVGGAGSEEDQQAQRHDRREPAGPDEVADHERVYLPCAGS